MIEKIKEIFSEYTFLSPRDLFQIAAIMKLKHISGGGHLVKEGDLNYNGFRVIKGLLAHYIIDKNGEK